MPELTGFSRPTVQTIIDRITADMNARLPGTEPRLRRAVLNVMAKVFAGAVHLLYGFISFIANQIIIDTAQKDWLVRHASLWGITRIAATFATGTVDFTGTNGNTIPEGTILLRADGAEFTTDALGTIAGGTASVAVTAAVAGLDGNTDPATTLTLSGQLTGIDSIATIDASGLTNGTDEETDTNFRSRVLARIQEPPHGGASFDYVAWAKEVAGVTRAWVSPLELGLSAVTVRFVRDGDTGSIIPDAAEVAAVQTYIDNLRPVTADVTVVAPVAVTMNFTISVTPDTAAIRAAIETELADMLLRDAEPGATIFLSRINEAISIGAGEFNHTLTVPAADVTHTTAEMAIMGTVTWV